MDAASALQTTGDRSEAKNQIDALRQEIKTKQSDIKNLEANLAKEAEAYYAPQIDDLKDYSRAVNITLGVVITVSVFVAVALLFSGKINDELRRCLLCLTSGVLGSATSAFISSLDRRAHGWEIGGVKIPPGEGERFNEKMVPFFLGRPLLGFLVGLLVYTAGMAEVLFKPEGTTDPAKSVYRLVFYSLLAGLFAKSLIEKLKAIFDYVFGA